MSSESIEEVHGDGRSANLREESGCSSESSSGRVSDEGC